MDDTIILTVYEYDSLAEGPFPRRGLSDITVDVSILESNNSFQNGNNQNVFKHKSISNKTLYVTA